MLSAKQQIDQTFIKEKIQNHLSWFDRISGMKAEKLIRGKKPYHYILRSGENENAYYVTFCHKDGSVRHQPFTIKPSLEGWYFENGGTGGPFKDATIDDVLHLIMHCDKEECQPLTFA